MCGIAGIFFFEGSSSKFPFVKDKVLSGLKHRGPDDHGVVDYPKCTLFHSRLSILDLSDASKQPFTVAKKSMVYNGEIFNYKSLSSNLSDIKTSGDAEVLFRLFEEERTDCLNKLNGFFAFSFYDSLADELYLVRDRFGVKPLYYYFDNNKLAFASEIKPLLELCGPQPINSNALYTYLRLNYISGKETIFKNIFRLLPGEFVSVKKDKIEINNWYSYPKANTGENLNDLLNDAVKLRLHADVPVGCFLSGGLDSSIISALAAKQHSHLHTFSLGYADEPFFDETHYSNMVAKHIGSNHSVFKLSNNDFLNHLPSFLNGMDEPFADSSALNTYILSEQTAKKVKVALSGDGADELFMGYSKHKAEFLTSKFIYKNIIPLSNPVLAAFSGSRNSAFSNKIRQLKRFASSAKLPAEARYINWACISGSKEVDSLLTIKSGRNYFLNLFDEGFSQSNFNPVNYCDLKIVLADDMLVKTDRMSMRHALEVRSPFLDYRVAEYALNLPLEKKINSGGQKLILKETFNNLLPQEIFSRSKKGFELPLWKWLNKELKKDIEQKWLSKSVIEDQKIFNYEAVSALKNKLFSNSPGDAPAKIWALIVFQSWYSNFKEFIKE